jgi:hypothetical protein
MFFLDMIDNLLVQDGSDYAYGLAVIQGQFFEV